MKLSAFQRMKEVVLEAGKRKKKNTLKILCCWFVVFFFFICKMVEKTSMHLLICERTVLFVIEQTF